MAQRPVSKGGPGRKLLEQGRQSQFENSIHQKSNMENKQNQPWEKPSGAPLQRRSSSPYSLRLQLFQPLVTKSSPGFAHGPGAPPLPWPDPQAWTRPPTPTPPRHPPFSRRWDLRSPRLTVGVSAAFLRNIPGRERWDREGTTRSLSLNRGWPGQVFPLGLKPAHSASFPQCQSTLWSEMFSASQGQTRQTTRAHSSQSLTLSQSLQVFKGETPPFFLQLLPYASAAPIVKAKILIFPHLFSFVRTAGKGFSPSPPCLGSGPLALLSVQKMSLRRFLTLPLSS